MTNSNLIPVFNGLIANQTLQLCNARELHQFVESKRQYSHWIKDRISDYGFVQNEDYIIVTERTNGRPRKEYHITLDMGKELAMVERNEKGRQVRKYFIARERQAYQLQKTQQPTLPQPESDEEAILVISNLYHALNEAYELVGKLNCQAPHIAQAIDREFGGRYLYNLKHPTENSLEKARQYIQAKSERIMFVKGMISLLEETPQPKRLAHR